MKHNAKRLLSLVIVLALAMSMLPVISFAADTTTLYCQAPDDWTGCMVYWWGSTGENPSWPGVAMAKNENGLWFYDVPSSATNVIFNNGSGKQSADLSMPADDNVVFHYTSKVWSTKDQPAPELSFYVAGSMNGWIPNDPAYQMAKQSDGSYTLTLSMEAGIHELKVTDGTWNNSWGDPKSPKDNYIFTADTAGEATVVFNGQTVQVIGDVLNTPEYYTIYYQHSADWTSCNVHWWGSSLDNPSWPGVAMTPKKSGIWMGQVPSDALGVVFNDGGSNQSEDLPAPQSNGQVYTANGEDYHYEYYVAGTFNSWTMYDAAYRMNDQGNSTYSLTVSVAAGVHELIVYNDFAQWGSGTSNYMINVVRDGEITVHFDRNTETVSVSGDCLGEYVPEETITRAQWIANLVQQFGMSVESGNYPDNYFSDLSSISAYYQDMLLAVEFGVLNVEAGEPVYPNQAATREFAAQTLYFCLGFQPDENMEYTYSDQGDVTNKAAAQTALNRGWFSPVGGAFKPKQCITSAEQTAMLQDAAAVLAKDAVDDDYANRVTVAEGVVEVPAGTLFEMHSDNVIELKDCVVTIQPGNVFVVYNNPLPMVFKALEVETADGVTTISYTTEGTEGALADYDFEGTIEADLENFEGTPATTFTVGKTQVYLSKTARSISYDQGSKTLTASKTVSLGDGVEATISARISNLQFQLRSKKLKCDYRCVMTGNATLTTNVSVDLLEVLGAEKTVSLGKVLVAGVGYVELAVEFSLSGEVSLVWIGNIEAGFSYNRSEGFRTIRSFSKQDFYFTAEVTMRTGLKISAGVDALVFKASVWAKIGAHMTVNATSHSSGTPRNCLDMAGYMYASVGVDGSIIGIFNFGKSYDIFTGSNSPIRVYYHYEDGKWVSGCSRGCGGYGYYTDPSSRNFNPGLSYGSSKYLSSNGQLITVYTYTLDKDNNATITGYNGVGSALSIPKTLDGYPVVAIGNDAFKNRTGLRSVRIPNSVKVIKRSAFDGCSNLSVVTLSSGLDTIEAYAFCGCVSLTEISLPDTITEIHEGAFLNCSALSYVKLSKGLKKMVAFAFYNCDALTSIEIPKSLESTNDAYINSIHYGYVYGVFYGCDNLTNITFEEGATVVANGLFAYCPGIQAVTIPDTVTVIKSNAFEACKNLKMVQLSSGLTKIEGHAFNNCTALTAVEIPDAVTEIQSGAFLNCSALSSVKLPKGLTKMGAFAFYNCDALTAIEIPKNLESTTDAYINSIHYGYVYGVFYGCDNLTDITFEEGATVVANGLFAHCPGIQTVTIPDAITVIESNAFEACENLETVKLSSALTRIEGHAFNNCTALTRVEIPDAVAEIQCGAFLNCSALSSVKLSKGLKTMGAFAFYNCDALTAIEIPKNLESTTDAYINSIHYGYVYGVFYGCDGLKDITFEEGAATIANGLFAYCPGIETIEIPQTITTIKSQVFNNCKNLKTIVIPDTVTSVGSDVFLNCTALESATWTSGTTTLPVSTFNGCTALVTVTLPQTLNYIERYAFNNCDSLVTIEIPDGVTTMNECVFRDCAALSSIKLPAKLKSVSKEAFYNCDALTSIEIPYGATYVDQKAFYDCDALETVIMGNTVTNMGSAVFQHCDVLANVTLSRNLTNIPSHTFRECPQLKQIVLPYNCTKVGDNAFNSSSKLAKVYVQNAITSISNNAFSYPNVTVFYGPAGSYVQTWAGEQGYTYLENTSTATAVALRHTQLSLAKGEKSVLDITVTPAEAGDIISFLSSKPEVVTVDETGKITAVGVGTATVKVYVGSHSASCKVTVTQAITKLRLNTNKLNLNVPETYQLTATITPSDASNQTLTWASSNEAAATVDGNGLVTAVGNGTATITATANDGSGISAGCTVTVIDPNNIPVSGISLNKTSLSMDSLDTFQLTATVSPNNAANKTLTWTSSDEAVAIVDQNGLVTAISRGTSTITASASDGSGITKLCTVTVNNTAHIVESPEDFQSSHPYAANCSDIWVYTAKGADQLTVTFDAQTEVEEDFDFIMVYDNSGNLVGEYTGTQLAGQTLQISGDTLKIKLLTNAFDHQWGFKVVDIQANVSSGSFSSTVKSYGDAADPITLQLTPEGSDTAAYTETLSGSADFRFEGVAPGQYTLTVSKKNHATRSYTVTLGSENITLDVKICQIGDVTGDGRINAGDVAKLFAHIKGGTLLTDEYAMACANANGGRLNIGDVATIYAHVTGNTPLFYTSSL